MTPDSRERIPGASVEAQKSRGAYTHSTFWPNRFTALRGAIRIVLSGNAEPYELLPPSPSTWSGGKNPPLDSDTMIGRVEFVLCLIDSVMTVGAASFRATLADTLKT